LVVGAGVVGMACARALQRAGQDVVVLDAAEPGSGCSSGNAGVIATDHLLPLARPATLARLPRMLLDPDSPLYLRPGRLPGLASWFARFLWACRPAQVHRGTIATAALTGRALAAWEVELASAGASALLRRSGMYEVCEDATGFAGAVRGRALAESFGVPVEVLSGPELCSREPALRPGLAGALYYPEVAHVVDPLRVVQVLTLAFAAGGGRLLRGRATAVRTVAEGVAVATEAGTLTAGHVVIAAGIGSRDLCRSLGFDPPLVAEMGYHVALSGAEVRLGAPVASSAGGFIVTPMADQLRIAGTVEFARRAEPPDWRRAAVLERRAARLFRDPLQPADGRWRGCRPTLPDFLPAIGPVPGRPGVLAAFGHQHIGLTTAALTGAIVRDLVLGAPPGFDLSPYAPGRFRG